MAIEIQLGAVRAELEHKRIKNIHLSVNPPSGVVRITAPLGMDVAVIRLFAISKLSWIKAQQRKMQGQERAAPPEYLERESHYVWGRRYLLKIETTQSATTIDLKHNKMIVRVHPNADIKQQLERWYRSELRRAAMPLLAQWSTLMGVEVQNLFIQRMKTKWGSCNHKLGNIRLNSELAKKPRECLEYIIVHELVHLLEPTHGAQFIALMDGFMPKWRYYREQLNALSVHHAKWKY